MSIRKYKYYFRKPRSVIAKEILLTIALGGMFMISTPSPSFGIEVWKILGRKKKYPKRTFADTFTRLYRKGLIEIEQEGYNVKIALSPKGKEVAGYMQIDALKISHPKKWDGYWRIIIFDISDLKTLHRNAFRAKLKDLGFLPLQKSIWIHPFDCKPEVELLRDFFGLSEKEVRLIVAKDIGDDTSFKEHFHLSPLLN